MVALYVTSLENGSGKTTLCTGLGKHLLNDGKKIGFFKPVIADSKNPPTEGIDSDATFMKHLFGLEEPVDLLCPVFDNESNLKSKLKEAYAKVSQGKDVVILEGISLQNQISHDIAQALDARVIVVEGYSNEPLKAINSYQDLGTYLLGIVSNKVPGSRMEQARSEISAQLNKAGINILGILPEDRALLALTIGKLTERIQGEI